MGQNGLHVRFGVPQDVEKPFAHGGDLVPLEVGQLVDERRVVQHEDDEGKFQIGLGEQQRVACRRHIDRGKLDVEFAFAEGVGHVLFGNGVGDEADAEAGFKPFGVFAGDAFLFAERGKAFEGQAGRQDSHVEFGVCLQPTLFLLRQVQLRLGNGGECRRQNEEDGERHMKSKKRKEMHGNQVPLAWRGRKKGSQGLIRQIVL